MAASPQHLNLKRWKRKFLGITEEGTDVREDVYAKAQKLINIFRQLSVLSKDSIEHYNEMVLNISPDIRSVLSTLPCGSDVRGYISYLQERRGLPIEEDDEDELEMSEGRKQAEIIAEAISKSTSKTAEQMQEQSMKQVELLTKTLAEAQSKNASIDDIAKITAAIQAAQAANPAMAMPAAGAPVPTQKVKKKITDENGEEVEVEVDEPIPGAQGGYYPVAPLVSGDGAAAAAAIGNAVADAIVKSQQQTSEIIAKMLGDAMSKPQQVQNDSLKEISGMLAASQEKTANIILASVGDAISKPQQVQNDNIKEIAAMLAESNEKTVNAISTSIREALSGSPVSTHGENSSDTINQLATLIAESQDKTAKTILEALGNVLDNSPETGGGLKEVAKMLTESQEKTASIIADSLATIATKEEKQESGKQDTIMMLLEAQEENSRMLTQILGKLAEKEGIQLSDSPNVDASSDSQAHEDADKTKAKPQNQELALALEPEDDDNYDSADDTPLFGDFDESEFFPPLSAVKPEPRPNRTPISAAELQANIDQLKSTLEEIDDTIEPEYLGDIPNIPKNAPSSSENQPSDIDTDFEYDFYELDENGNLVPFNPELNPDVEYEIIENVEDGSDRLASFAKSEQLAAPDITDSLENFEDIKPEPEPEPKHEEKPAPEPEHKEIPAPQFFTGAPAKGKLDFEGLFEEDFSFTDYDIADDYPSSWINNSASASFPKQDANKFSAHDFVSDAYKEEKASAPKPKEKSSAKPTKQQGLLTNSTKAIGHAPAKKEIGFAATKQLAAPSSPEEENEPAPKPKPKTKAKAKAKPKTKAKAKTKAKEKAKAKEKTEPKTKAKPKVKAEKVKQKSISAPRTKAKEKDKSDKPDSDTKNYCIKDKSQKSATSAPKNKKRPFVIMFSDSEADPEKIEID